MVVIHLYLYYKTEVVRNGIGCDTLFGFMLEYHSHAMRLLMKGYFSKY